jgi:hypothetical protein
METRYQRKKEIIVKVSRYTCTLSFFFWLSELVSETIIRPRSNFAEISTQLDNNSLSH